MSSRLKAEPAFVKSLTSRLLRSLIEVMEKEGVPALTIADLRLLSERLDSSKK